jgi:hypothetical protein
MNAKRPIITVMVLLSVSNFCAAQNNLLKRSWIAVYVEEFRKAAPQSDTAYIRYTFQNGNLLIGFQPAWNMFQMPYSVNKKTLTLQSGEWKIEELTDSTLTIFQKGFRRMKFVPEAPFQNMEEFLIQIGEHNGKPLYKANQVITPRYNSPNQLATDIKTPGGSGDYNTTSGGTLIMTFIVTEEGTIEDPKIIRGLAPGFDEDYKNGLLKTSKHWTPAMFRGRPVQTRVVLQVNYLSTRPEDNQH